MTPHIGPPRLLPATIATLAVVLAMKTTVLVRSAIDKAQPAALITATWAAGSDTPMAPEKHDDKAGAKPGAKTGDQGQATKPGRGAEKPAETSTAADTPPLPDGPPPMTDGEKAVLLELRDRRLELEAREASLTSRQSMLAAAEKKLSARVDELQDLQKRLEALDASHRQQEESAWQSLVKVYEAMKPRDAATIFNDLGMPVLLAVVDRMKETKAAAILAAMTPEKARDVTMQLAQVRTKPAAAADAGGKSPANPEPGKASRAGT
jgi:flagellar motility protein MotE (MotC chaperone)